MPPYDSLLLISFGGPEGRDDVIPSLENVTRGRGVPRERLEQVAEHYSQFGGVSPINQQCRDLLAAIEKEFAASGVDLPVYWGNRNWDPLLTDTVAAMAADGRRHAIAFVTSAYSSYSSCRQYLEDIERARAAVPDAPRIDKLRQYFNHPGFVEPFADAARSAAESLPLPVQGTYDLVFTAHSIPEAMAGASGPTGGAYPRQLAEASRLVAERLRRGRGGPGRLHLRSHGGRLRPRRGGGAARRAAGPAAGARGDTEHRPAVRRDDHRAGLRTAVRAAARGARRAGADPSRMRQRVLRR